MATELPGQSTHAESLPFHQNDFRRTRTGSPVGSLWSGNNSPNSQSSSSLPVPGAENLEPFEFHSLGDLGEPNATISHPDLDTHADHLLTTTIDDEYIPLTGRDSSFELSIVPPSPPPSPSAAAKLLLNPRALDTPEPTKTLKYTLSHRSLAEAALAEREHRSRRHDWTISELLGVHPTGPNRGSDYRGRDTDYSQKYGPDKPLQEASENSRMWKTYLDESEIFDDEMIRKWTDTLSMLLVFAALFSAILATFVVETLQDLQPDYTQISATLLVRLVNAVEANGTSSTTVVALPADPASGFVPDISVVWVNAIFFVSLTLGLTTALMVVLVRQWLYAYESNPSGTARDRSLIRQYRYMGIKKWQVPLIIGFLPVLLHVALILFLAGLVLLLWSRNIVIAGIVTSMTGITLFAYIASHVWAIINPQCPYKTPLVTLFFSLYSHLKKFVTHRSQRAGLSAEFRSRDSPSGPSGLVESEREAEFKHVLKADASSSLQVDAMQWLDIHSYNPTVRPILFDAIGGLPASSLDKAMATFHYEKVIIEALGFYARTKDQARVEFANFLRTCAFLDLTEVPADLFKNVIDYPAVADASSDLMVIALQPQADSTISLESILFKKGIELPTPFWAILIRSVVRNSRGNAPLLRNSPLPKLIRAIEDSNLTRYLKYLSYHRADRHPHQQATALITFPNYQMSEDELTLLTEPFIPMLSDFDDLEHTSFSPWLRLLISCNNLFVETSVNIDITNPMNLSLFVLQRYTVRCLRAERFWGADSTKQERRAIFQAMQNFVASSLFVQMHSDKELREICDTAITVCFLLFRHDRRILSADGHNPLFLKNLVRRLKITRDSEDSSIHVPDRIVVSFTLVHSLSQSVDKACELFMEEDLLQLLGGYFPKYNKGNKEAIEAARAAIGVAVGAYVVAVRNSFLSGWEWALKKTALPNAHMHLRYLHQRENLYQAFLSLVMSHDVSDYRLHALAHVWPHSLLLWAQYRRRAEARKLPRYKIRDFRALLGSSEAGAVIRCSVLDAECYVTPLDHALGSCQPHTVMERSIGYLKILHCVFTKHEEADAKQLPVFRTGNITEALASAVPSALPWGARSASMDVHAPGDLDVNRGDQQDVGDVNEEANSAHVRFRRQFEPEAEERQHTAR